MQELPKGAVILGFPRSGTTLLRRMLGAHSQIAAPSETYLLSACARFFHSLRVAGNVPVGARSGLGFLGFSADNVEERVRELAFSFYRDHLRATGKSRWIEKTALDSFHVDEIDRIFGAHISYIVLHRHGADVALSTREWCEKIEAYPEEIHSYVRQYPRSLEAFAHAWVDVSRKLSDLARKPSTRALIVRYEDLVEDPEREIRRIADFLQIDFEDAMIEQGPRMPGEGFGDWKAYGTSEIREDRRERWRRLPTTTLTELAPILNDTLIELGYPALAAKSVLSDDEACRRYQLGLRLQHQIPTPNEPKLFG